mgnify:CR=1 FL=1
MKQLLICLLVMYCAVAKASAPIVRFGILAHDEHYQTNPDYAALQDFLAEQMAPAVAQLLQEETGLDPQLEGFLALCKQYRLSD